MAGTVLLVDDSDLVADIVAEAFAAAGYAVERARNGLEGIELAYRLAPDLIVMDVEMPILKGYQASRLLKRRRGVKDIPIIMHTSCSEDSDRFWAFTSGVDAFVPKDFDHLEVLVGKARELIGRTLPDAAVIREDAKRMTPAAITECLSNSEDEALFRSTVLNRLAETARRIASPAATIQAVLELVDVVCERHIGAVVVRHGKEAQPYFLVGPALVESDLEDFAAVCMGDFYAHFDPAAVAPGKRTVYGVDERADFKRIRLDKERLCAYACFPLKGKGDAAIGTFHLGHLRNNYFSPAVLETLEVFVREAGIIIENSLLLQHVTELERDLRSVFAKFVPAEIIDDLIARKSAAAMLSGEKRRVTVLFSDIRDFTAISEANPPEAVVAFLNRYLGEMCQVVEAAGGTIDKFIGDAVLAVFGAPKSYPDNAGRATRAALEMLRRLPSIPLGGLKLPGAGLRIGIGIHTGDSIVGNIGSQTKQDYTVIGDTVNLASRLESLTKHYGLPLIISETVAAELDGEFATREIDSVQVKGKDIATAIFAVAAPGVDGWDEAALAAYAKGLSMYRLRNWSAAADLFEAVLAAKSDDALSRMYAERCRRFIADPPPDDWNFVERYVTK